MKIIERKNFFSSVVDTLYVGLSRAMYGVNRTRLKIDQLLAIRKQRTP